MFRLDGDILSLDMLRKFIDRHRTSFERYQMLSNYYKGEHRILTTGAAKDKNSNKIVNPYPKYITDFNTGFFMGKGVKYIAANREGTEDDEFLESYTEICELNNESKENLSLARTCSIKGEAFELLWVDEEARVRFKLVEPENAFLIYDMSIEAKPIFGVRYYRSEIDGYNVEFAEVYDSKSKKVYSSAKDKTLKLIEESYHPFGAVPLIHFKNNGDLQGDFEQVISLIDAYNREQSNTLNDMDDFSDAYLALVNYQASDENDIEDMKKSKVLLLDSDGDAKWLIKDINDAWVENMKIRLNKDIHKFSFTPDFSDESFGTNVPGVSLRLKLLTSEELRNTKEMYFREALTCRMDLIASFLNVSKTKEIVKNQIKIQFSDSLPQNILELTQIVQNLTNDLSTETRLSLLPFVENPSDEIEKKEQEDRENMENSYGIYKNLGANNGKEESKESDLLAKEE